LRCDEKENILVSEEIATADANLQEIAELRAHIAALLDAGSDLLRIIDRAFEVGYRIDANGPGVYAARVTINAERPGKAVLAELKLLRELRTDVERWSESGGDHRDARYILDTLEQLSAQFPKASGE
jgi:hypothetical protein